MIAPTSFYSDDVLAWLTAGWLGDDDPFVTVRGDNDVRWSDACDDGDDDYPFETPRHLRREVK